MQPLTSIVAVNEQGAIGAGNSLPWRVRSDLEFFRDTTIGKVVIMGRKTFDSLGKPLPKRTNIIVSHRFSLFSETPECRIAHSIPEALLLANKLSDKGSEAFVVGGASMYKQFSPFVSRYLITEVDKNVPDADTFFDRDIIGSVSDWDIDLIKCGRKDGFRDEADYKIFDLRARDVNSYRSSIFELLQANSGNRRSAPRTPRQVRRFA